MKSSGEKYLLTPATLRAARALLGMGIRELAAAAAVNTVTINGFELGRTKLQVATALKIEAVLRAKGVELIVEADREGALMPRLRQEVVK